MPYVPVKTARIRLAKFLDGQYLIGKSYLSVKVTGVVLSVAEAILLWQGVSCFLRFNYLHVSVGVKYLLQYP